MSETATDALIGQRLADRFEIEARVDLDDGSEVYRARDVRLDRELAVRIVPPPPDRAAFLARLKAAEAIGHPNVLRVHAGDTLDDGRGWIATDPIEGPTLARVLDREGGALDLARAVHIGRQLATALQAAHRQGLVHGRLDPWHIRIVEAYGSDEWAVVHGFAFPGDDLHEDWHPPESGAATGATDLWLLGALLHRMATGELSDDDLRPGDSVPPPLDSVVYRLLDPDPAERPSAETVVHHIDGSSAFQLRGVTAEATQTVPANNNVHAEAAAQPLFFLIGGLVAAAVVALLGGLGFLWNEKRKEEDEGGEHVLVAQFAPVAAAERALPVRTPLPDTHRDAFLTALAHARWATEDSTQRGLDALGVVLDAHPDFAPAHALAAELHLDRALAGQPEWSAARSHARQALALQPQRADALAASALAEGVLFGNWTAAERTLQRAVSLDPGAVAPRRWHAAALAGRGHLQRAVAEARAAVELDPLGAMLQVELAELHRLAGQPDLAERVLHTVLRTQPELVEAQAALGRAWVALGRTDDAIRVFQRLDDRALLSWALAVAGRADAALAVLADVSGDHDRARTLVALGRTDEALDHLERATPSLYLAVEPAFAALRTEPRFQAIAGWPTR